MYLAFLASVNIPFGETFRGSRVVDGNSEHADFGNDPGSI
jgi:hypothetical protein